MKKLLATVLVLVMIFTALPVSISAEETHYVFGPGALNAHKGYTLVGLESSLVKDGDAIYVHNIATSGTYANNKLMISFKPGNFAPADYPFMKVGYRSDSTYSKLNTSARSGGGKNERWFKNHPQITADGKWQDQVIDLNDLTGGVGPLEKGDSNVEIVLKPLGTDNAVVKGISYFDISYLAFFKTKAEADAYKFTMEDDTASLTGIVSAETVKANEEKLLVTIKEKEAQEAKEAQAEAEKRAEEEAKIKEALKDLPSTFIYGANKLDKDFLYSVVGFDYERLEEDGFSYLHAVVKPGDYTNNKLMITFAPLEIALADHRYVKIGYRTDSFFNKLNFSSVSKIGESWHGNGHPGQTADGKWHEIILDTHSLTGGKGIPQSGDTTANVILKPYGSGNVTVTKESYFDIKYIACFANYTDAEKYKYSPDDDIKVEGGDIYADALITDDGTKLAQYMAEADALRDEIIASPTNVEVTGRKFYVSASGNDSNSGLSPTEPWKTLSKVSNYNFKEGDGVFFKRGDSFRGSLYVKTGVTYSAYGEGAKPQIISSLNASGGANWVETEYENIYAYVGKLRDVQSVGNIIFDGGDAWGIQIQRTIAEGLWYNIGRVYNGLEWFDTPTGKMNGYMDLCYDLQFFHDTDVNTLYVYSKDGNPGERFSSVEIVIKVSGIGITRATPDEIPHDILIDNIEVYGAGVHGISMGNIKDVTVQYCVFKWIGGSIQGVGLFGNDYGVRLGNAVESYGSSENFEIKYCYTTQIYDCCWTVQAQQGAVFNGVSMHHNVSEFCNTGLEIWNDDGIVKGLDLHDNYTRFNGYGWSYQRPNKDSNFFYGGAGGLGNKFEDNNIYNNVNLLSRYFAYKVRTTGPEQYNFHDNIYLMEEGKKLGGIAANPGTGQGTFADKPYDSANIARALSTGFEKGSTFYVIAPEPYGDMFDLYVPEKVGISAFDDITKDFWGRSAISYVLAEGYFNGTSKTTFAPNGTMTRAMLVTVLSRMAGVSGDTSKITYTDVNKEAWYASGVAWAEQLGIVNAGGKFRPDENATREELADMLYRAAYCFYTKIDINAAPDFKDMSSANSEYADGIKFCTKNGIIGGYTDGTIKPANSATRAEVATMIMRFAKYLKEAPVDFDRIFAESKSVKLDAATLKTMTSAYVMKAADDANAAKFVPSAATGKPNINVYNIKNTDVNFIEYPYVAVVFDSNIESEKKTLMMSDSTGAAIKDSDVTLIFEKQSGAVAFDFSEYAREKAKELYTYDAVIRIFPWGTSVFELPADSYFAVKEIVFFDNMLAAEVYAQQNS